MVIASVKKLLEPPEAVAQRLPFADQLVENGGVGLRRAVQQHDRAGMDARDELGKRLLRRRLIVLIPVDIGKAPEHGVIAELLRHFEIFLGIDALRRAVEFCKLLPGRVTVERLEGLELLPELLHLPDLRHVPVVVGVIADRMPLLRHAPDEVWISLDVVADQEECRRSMVLLQRIEDLRRAAVFIACIEREIDALLRRIAKEGRIILPQPVRRGVSHGRLALLLEAQAPRACRERRCLGIGYVPQDRLNEGVNYGAELWESAIMGYHVAHGFKHRALLDYKEIRRFSKKVIKDYAVKTPDEHAKVKTLSGGNVQKLIVGREFDQDNKLLIIVDPTRGIDIGAIEFIWKKIIAMAAEGAAILLVSHELNEVMELSDRILVMYDGNLCDAGKAGEATEEEIGLLMMKGKSDQ